MAKQKLNNNVVENINSIFRDYTQTIQIMKPVRDRMELTDRYIQRTNDRSPEAQAARAARARGDVSKIPNLEMPVVFPQVDTAHAHLVGTFCTGMPVFGFVSDVQKMPAAQMLMGMTARDQERFNWISEFMTALYNAVKHNICPVECVWAKMNIAQFTNQAGATVASMANAAGVKYKALDPYNTFYDITVNPDKVHLDGAYAGYVERVHYIGLKKLIAQMNPDYLVTQNLERAYQNANSTNFYVIPDVQLDATAGMNINWDIFHGATRNTINAHSCGKYEVIKMYARLIPKDLGFTWINRSGEPTVFEFVYVGNTLIYAEPLQNAHGCIPIVIGRGFADLQGMQNKSFAENITDLQDAATAIMNGSLNSLRRAVADRAIYNPRYIDGADAISGNPAAKIPIKVGTYTGDLKSVYMSIPYNDSTYGFMKDNLNTVVSFGQNASGLNPAAQGNFVKGNKTLTEYNDVMSNSDARIKKFELNLEYTLMMPLRLMAKLNYMQYSGIQTVPDPANPGQTVSVDPATLITFAFDFKGTDGVMPNSKAVNGEVLAAALNGIAQMPELDMEYSRAKMYTYLLRSENIDLSQFARTPQEKQQYLQMLQAQAAAANPQQQQPPAGQ